MKAISIIIPIYNASEHLTMCLDSVINQTLKDIEIICVNDGSTDNSLDIIKKFALKDKRIVIIDKKNAGMGAAYNSGLDIAKGKYIGFVEPDDFISLNMYEELYNCSIHKTDIIQSDWFLYKKNKVDKENKYSKFKEGIYKNEDVKNILLKFGLGHWSCIYKNKDFIQKYKIRFNSTPGAAFQDTGFTIKTNLLANSIYIKPKQYYYYRIHDNQSINTKINIHFRNLIWEFNSVLDYLKNNTEAREKCDLKLLNTYSYRLFYVHYMTLAYIKKLHKIFNSKLFLEGYSPNNFSQLENSLYLNIKTNPYMAYLKHLTTKLNLLKICYI